MLANLYKPPIYEKKNTRPLDNGSENEVAGSLCVSLRIYQLFCDEN